MDGTVEKSAAIEKPVSEKSAAKKLADIKSVSVKKTKKPTGNVMKEKEASTPKPNYVDYFVENLINTPELDTKMRELITTFSSNPVYAHCPQQFHPSILYRYLTGYRCNVSLATSKLHDYFQWYSSYGVENLRSLEHFSFRKPLRAVYPHGYFHVDKQGRPVYVECVGQLSHKTLLKVESIDEILRYFVQEYEYLSSVMLPICSIHAKKSIRQTFSIVDVKGLGLSHMNATNRNILKSILGISQTYFPELLGKMVIINAPKIFSMFWSIAKALIDEKTAAKVVICCTVESARQTLSEYIDEQNLNQLLIDGVINTSVFQDSPGPWKNFDYIKQLHEMHPHVPVHLLFAACDRKTRQANERLLDGASMDTASEKNSDTDDTDSDAEDDDSTENYTSDTSESIVTIGKAKLDDGEKNENSKSEVLTKSKEKVQTSNEVMNHKQISAAQKNIKKNEESTSKGRTLPSKSPTLTSKSPTLTSKSPTLASKSPTLTSKSPTLTSKSPILKSKSPKITPEDVSFVQDDSHVSNKKEADTLVNVDAETLIDITQDNYQIEKTECANVENTDTIVEDENNKRSDFVEVDAKDMSTVTNVDADTLKNNESNDQNQIGTIDVISM